jgi:dihydrofolate reductase
VTRFRAFLLVSADGYAAGPNDDIAWHARHFTHFGEAYQEFIAGVGAVIMGRRIFDLARTIPGWALAEGEWPGRDTYLCTSRAVEGAFPRVRKWSEGAGQLIRRLRATPPNGKIWVMGGPKTIACFRELGAIDQYDLFVARTLLGGGIPWSGTGSCCASLALTAVTPFPDGVVRTVYRPS